MNTCIFFTCALWPWESAFNFVTSSPEEEMYPGALEQKAGQLIQKYGERYMAQNALRPDDPLRDNQAGIQLAETLLTAWKYWVIQNFFSNCLRIVAKIYTRPCRWLRSAQCKIMRVCHAPCQLQAYFLMEDAVNIFEVKLLIDSLLYWVLLAGSWGILVTHYGKSYNAD